MNKYKKIENKWQEYWESNNVFKAIDNSDKKKQFNLVEFPYPSGKGMHLGHGKAYIGMEVLSRMQRRMGLNVLFPIGFDSFGLPAENYAIKMGVHPNIITKENEANFLKQLKGMGFSFDYDRVFSTTDPQYYKWTQWIFLKLFEKGLAYRDKTYVNYCPSCKVTLSNEDSQGGKCDRCSTDVILAEKDVWFLKITEYADKLLEGLEEVNFPPRVKLEQQNWIGKSIGAYVDFKTTNNQTLKVYTTRPDTLFGVTFMVIAPEHPLIEENKNLITNLDEINKYKEFASKKSEFERTQLVKDKTGVEIKGISAINPVNNKEIPIFIADYVMMGYGTGAIMAVPAHDERDYEFAIKYNIPIIKVIEGESDEPVYTGDGKMINSDFLNGIDNKKESIKKITEYLEKEGIGSSGVQYKMKDWAFNRQRYWGEPIPIINCPKCGMVPVPYEELPLKLPDLDNFLPGEAGESPLVNATEWVNCKCPKCNENAKRETDTMPQWAGSSWYFLRYTDPHNDNELASREKLDYWMNVDIYNGGAEHITRHMIYARFWHRFLYDLGVVKDKEPFEKRTTIGLILGSDNQKMSKSRGNIIDIGEVVQEYGADVIRTYILFMGDYSMEAPWSEASIKGVKRFLDRVEKLQEKLIDKNGITNELLINQTIKKVTDDINNLKYNTAISSLMVLLNEYEKYQSVTKEEYRTLLSLLNPFAPHITEELNELNNLGEVLCKSDWPTYEASKTISDKANIAVSVNGKLRSTISCPLDLDDKEVEALALQEENVKKHIEGKEVVKVVVVKNKIINIVIK